MFHVKTSKFMCELTGKHANRTNLQTIQVHVLKIICDTANLESKVMNIVHHLYFNKGQKSSYIMPSGQKSMPSGHKSMPSGHKSTTRGINGRLT